MPVKDSTRPLVSSSRGESGTMTENRLTVMMDRTQLDILEGDVTGMDVEAIVNPANETLQLESGVSAARPW